MPNLYSCKCAWGQTLVVSWKNKKEALEEISLWHWIYVTEEGISEITKKELRNIFKENNKLVPKNNEHIEVEYVSVH